MKICIVIPAYNEEQHIASTLKAVQNAGYENIVVVDDGSIDTTSDRARHYATTVRHLINRGMGASLVTGTKWALRNGADCIVHFDADGQHRANEIHRLIDPIAQDRADIVLGSRYLSASKTPFVKKYFIHKPERIVQNFTTGLRLTDVHNGFRALNRHAAEVIDLQQDRMAHASEVVSEIQRNRLRFMEVPVTISYHEFGQGFFGGLKIYWDLIS